MPKVEIITAKGHENIKGTHKTTFEITKEREISIRADCVIGVNADKGLLDMNNKIKNEIRKSKKLKFEIKLPDYDLSETVTAEGNVNLSLNHPTDMVVRKSTFICSRTLAIKSDKAAFDINREMIYLLSDPKTELIFIIFV